MNPQSRETRNALRALERRLVARRLGALTGRMRVALVLLAGYAAAFAYWQARVPLDGIRRARGETAAAWTLAAVLAALALLGALAVAWRRVALAERPAGPEWLALPLPPGEVCAHLGREAQQASLATLPAALAVFAAGIGLVSPLRLVAIAIACVLLWALPARIAARLAARAGRAVTPAALRLPAATREILAAGRTTAARPHRAPRWRTERAWRAIARIDGLSLWRRSHARTHLALAAPWFVAGAAAWFAPAPPLTRRALAYAAFAGGAAALGAWAIARTCSDPPAVFRPLPLRVRDAWFARASRLALVLAAACALDALLAWSLPPMARVGLVLTFLPSGAAIALLGLNYGITLAPRAVIAEYLFYGWLCVALVASWMIPFLGWGVLVAGLAHSGMRLSRAARTEVA